MHACERHLRDLINGHERGLSWHPELVGRVIRFFKKILTVELETRDPDTGEISSDPVPFNLEPWQIFILGSIYAWKKRGIRRFRRAYCEVGKGNGKSAMLAGVGHYMLIGDGKLRAEIYAAAAQREQAMVIFRDAVEMWRRSRHLSKLVMPSGQKHIWQLTYVPMQSFFKALSSENQGRSGIRPYCGLLDEIHEHKDNSVIELLRAGTKGNQEALIFEITNSGFDRHSVCWAEHEYSSRVVKGLVENDAWFAYVCGLDEQDDPFADEACWIKANPNLGVSIHSAFIREQVAEARGLPSKESIVRRLNFCQWVDAENAWISTRVWNACVIDGMDIDDFAGRDCYGGLDLSSKLDPASLVLAFPGDDINGKPSYDVFSWFWVPRNRLGEAEKRDGVPYRNWLRDKFLRAPDGDVIDYADIAKIIAEADQKFKIRQLAFDPHKIEYLKNALDEIGVRVELAEHSQGYRRAKASSLWMHESIEQTEAAIQERRVRVCFNPMLNWNVASAIVVEDEAKNRKFEKRRATGRIDGAVAMAMAIGVATAMPERQPEYQMFVFG